jgi:maltooligosyltrehalose trehalohydrolase
MLFMGEEYGETNPFLFFSSHPEEWLADAVRTGRRDEFATFSAFEASDVPDPQAADTYRASILNRGAATTDAGAARRRLWTDLLEMRRTVPALTTGNRRLVESLVATREHLAVRRHDPAGASPVIVVANAQGRQTTIEVPEAGRWRSRWSSAHPDYQGPGTPVTVEARVGHLDCTVPAWTVALLTDGAIETAT